MSLLGQLKPSYNQHDEGQNLSDIRGVLGLFSLEQQKQFEQKILMIISEPGNMLHQIRDLLYVTIKSTIDSEGDIKIKVRTGFDSINNSFRQLDYLYEIIAKNPILGKAFLETLTSNISDQLALIPSRDINIAKEINEISDENFLDTIAKISQDGGHLVTIYLLGECIREGKCLDSVRYYIYNNAGSTLSGGNLEDMDYQNLLSQLNFRTSIDTKNRVGKSFSLSGGVSNALSQLGYIRAFLADGGQIQSISGTSMGAIVAVLVSKAVGQKTGQDAVSAIDSIIEKLSGKLDNKIFDLGKIGKLPFIHVSKVPEFLKKERTAVSTRDIAAIENIFLSIAHEYGIRDTTQFSELEIPVIVNASYQSEGKGEKEIVLSGENLIIESLFAGANMPSMFGTNIGIFGEKSVQGQNMIDFAANEQGNPISLLSNSGISMKDIIALDVGYSSNSYNTGAAKFSRWFFRRALFRDSLQKTMVRMQEGLSIDIDSEPSNNASGANFSPEILRNLVKIGQSRYQKI